MTGYQRIMPHALLFASDAFLSWDESVYGLHQFVPGFSDPGFCRRDFPGSGPWRLIWQSAGDPSQED